MLKQKKKNVELKELLALEQVTLVFKKDA